MTLDPAATVAAAICWIARQPGLPDAPTLRHAAVNRHQMACAWCDYDLDGLIRLIEEANGDVEAMRRFGRLPRSEQRRQVDDAQQSELIA